MDFCKSCLDGKICLYRKGIYTNEDGSPNGLVCDSVIDKLYNQCHHIKEDKCINCATDDEINTSMKTCKNINRGKKECITCSTPYVMKCNENINDYI